MSRITGKFIRFSGREIRLFVETEEEAELIQLAFPGTNRPEWVSLMGDPYYGLFQVDIKV